MVSLIPYQRKTLTTTLSQEDVLLRLRVNTVEGSPFKSFMRNLPTEPFRGELRDDGFQITRVVQFNNTTIPLVDGDLHDEGDRRRIDLLIRPGGSNVYFQAIVVLAFPVYLGINALLLARDGQPLSIILRLAFLAVGIFLIAYTPMMMFFNREATRVVDALREVLEAKSK